jgi:exodeoxyribonuclease-3
MKIASFNVNGVRARMGIVLDWIAKEKPSVLCIQETKVQDEDFPVAPLQDLSLHPLHWGQKAYNGVAIISDSEPEEVRVGLADGEDPEEARLISAKIHGVWIVNTYVPQGTDVDHPRFQYKLEWFERLGRYFQRHFEPEDPIIWMGDLNVAPDEKDVFDPKRLAGHVCFHPDEQAALSDVVSWGFVDIFRKHEPGEKQFTFFDYRLPKSVERNLGWRLDHIFATEPMADRSTRAWIDKEPRLLPKPSDHTPICAEFGKIKA